MELIKFLFELSVPQFFALIIVLIIVFSGIEGIVSTLKSNKRNCNCKDKDEEN